MFMYSYACVLLCSCTPMLVYSYARVLLCRRINGRRVRVEMSTGRSRSRGGGGGGGRYGGGPPRGGPRNDDYRPSRRWSIFFIYTYMSFSDHQLRSWKNAWVELMMAETVTDTEGTTSYCRQHGCDFDIHTCIIVCHVWYIFAQSTTDVVWLKSAEPLRNQSKLCPQKHAAISAVLVKLCSNPEVSKLWTWHKEKKQLEVEA